MATLTFAYNHARDPMNPDQLADQIGSAFNLSTNPTVDITPTQILVTHPQASEAQRVAVQALIDAYVFDPVWAGGVAAVLAAKAQAALTANATFLALGAAPTAAQVRDQVILATKELNALIRLATNLLDSTKGT